VSVNTAIASGRLVRDPELRYLPSGDSVFENAVAIDHYRKEGENEVSFVDFKVYGSFADLLASKVEKGNLITVSGYLKQESWETTEGKRSKLVIVANDVEGEFKFKKASEASAPVVASDEKPSAQTDDIPF
jgi:single-strand DNA-binding protein